MHEGRSSSHFFARVNAGCLLPQARGGSENRASVPGSLGSRSRSLFIGLGQLLNLSKSVSVHRKSSKEDDAYGVFKAELWVTCIAMCSVGQSF